MENQAEKSLLNQEAESGSSRSFSLFGPLFLALLLAVALCHLILPDQSYSASEKRGLTALPPLSLSSITEGEFMARAEDYVADQFPLRDSLMRIRSNLLRLLGETESKGVYYGKDGSLIQSFEAYDEALLQKTAEAINRFTRRFDFERALMLIIPTAVSQYEEKLPDYAESVSEMQYFQAFSSRLSPALKVPDSFEVMSSLKSAVPALYYHSDHHWTSQAAYGFFRMLSDDQGWKKGYWEKVLVSNAFGGSLVSKSGFTPPVLDALYVYENTNPRSQLMVLHSRNNETRGSLLEPAALEGDNPYEVFLGGDEPLLTIRTTADSERTLLMFKDSYANCFIPFLTESYKSITVVDPRYFAEPVSGLFLTESYSDCLWLYNIQTLAADESLAIVLGDIAE